MGPDTYGVRMKSGPRQHPPPDAILKYAAVKITGTRDCMIEAHAAVCQECRNALKAAVRRRRTSRDLFRSLSHFDPSIRVE